MCMQNEGQISVEMSASLVRPDLSHLWIGIMMLAIIAFIRCSGRANAVHHHLLYHDILHKHGLHFHRWSHTITMNWKLLLSNDIIDIMMLSQCVTRLWRGWWKDPYCATYTNNV